VLYLVVNAVLLQESADRTDKVAEALYQLGSYPYHIDAVAVLPARAVWMKPCATDQPWGTPPSSEGNKHILEKCEECGINWAAIVVILRDKNSQFDRLWLQITVVHLHAPGYT
jgi:hypothetical protein